MIKKEKVSEGEVNDFAKFTPEQQEEILALLASSKNKINQQASSPAQDQMELAKALAKEILSGIKGNEQDTFSEDAYVKSDYIDEQDMLREDEQVTFIAHKVFYVITCAKINNKNVQAPLGKIEFKFMGAKRNMKGKETDIFTFCCYTTKSKKERDFLMNHPLYGTMFFSNVNAAVSVDARRAAKLARAMTSLMSYGQSTLVNYAKQYQVPLVNDLQELRASIAARIADQQMKQEEESTIVRLKETKFENEILKNN